MDIVIKKLDPSMADDYFFFFDQIAFADHPEWGCECYCCFFHATSQEAWRDVTAAQNKAAALEMIQSGRLQGLLAYSSGKPVAWCHYDRKKNLPGIKVFYPELTGDSTDGDTAAIVCFTVAQGFRGQGLASRLLAAACADLAEQGCRLVEAFPSTAAENDEQHYHGPLSMYLAQGFAIARELPIMAIVRKFL